MAIRPETRAKIKGFLEAFVENVINQFRSKHLRGQAYPSLSLRMKSKKGYLKPFHSAIIPLGIMKLNAFERGFSTSLGTTFEECARLIALDYHEDARRSFDLVNPVSKAAYDRIAHEVSFYEKASRRGLGRPRLSEMVRSVLNSSREDDLFTPQPERADLYVKGRDGKIYLFEIKSPMPNKGQCLEVTQRILRFHLLAHQEPPALQAFFAMAYNPYGPSRDDYAWTNARNYMPFDEAVLIGDEFWTLIGGPGVYEELLDIYQEVGRDRAKYIIENLPL